MTRHRIKIVVSFLSLLFVATAHAADVESPATVKVFAAGSLRAVVGDLAAAVSRALHIDVKSSFGGSGALRERIERGERPDLLLSADMGSPLKLEAAGRTVVPATAFARNRMCILSRRASGVTTANLIDQLLARDVRVKTSTPVADPSGDYAWAIFDRIDQQRRGAGAALKAKATTLMDVVATPADAKQSAAAALFASRQVDMSITYCSAAHSVERELPELTSLVVPPALDPHPVYGLALLSSKPAAMQLALFLLSEKGQAILRSNGLVPMLEPTSLAH